MYHFKFIGLAISALMSFTPVNYDWDIWQFPQTRSVQAAWIYTYDVIDLGYSDKIDINAQLGNDALDVSTAKHWYRLNIILDIYCNQACSMANPEDGYNISSDHIRVYRARGMNLNANEMDAFIGNNYTNFVGSQTESFTFQDSSVNYLMTFSPVMFGRTYNIQVRFPATTQGMLLDDIANHTLNASSYLLRLTLNNQNIPDSVMTQYRQYIDNGDYSTAYTYITNYIDNKQITDNTETNTQVNNYETQHTSLNQYFTTENNFTNQVESDFNNNIQNVPLNDVQQKFTVPSFLRSANWVTDQFNRLTNNALGTLLQFSLVTGFVLALIGRFKR